MRPESPRISGLREVVYAKDQKEYIPLPAAVVEDPYGTVITRWRMSWRERLHVLLHGCVFISIMTFRKPLQPLMVDITPKKPLYVVPRVKKG